ncbi:MULTISPECIES: RICIN domain-containing protein [Alphaproteobacteria]|uniref:RICIN domain-containing protein n=1 Tax=Alphaproteobacteria TaxID=28211 RepID=UPI003267E099
MFEIEKYNKKVKLIAAAFVAVLGLGAVVSPAVSASIDPQVFYRLTTQFRGNDMCLDVFNGGEKNNMTHLAACADFSGQYWRLQPAGAGYYRLTTMFRGNSMCLDVYNGGSRNNQPHLTNCADFSGQFWKVTESGGWSRLTTQFRGAAMCLDIFNGGPDNNMPHLANCANFSGQFWKMTRTNKRP